MSPSPHTPGLPLYERQSAASAHARFGDRLRHWRRLRGLSQAELGRRLGYHDSHISRVETTRRWPPAGMAERTDQVLETGGELSVLWPAVEHERRAQRRRRSTDRVPPQPLEQLLDAARLAGWSPLGVNEAAHGQVIGTVMELLGDGARRGPAVG
ncbi:MULTISPECIES: helix-turn-helix domain-containing protein [Kitasatospora]|uniref:HTH cro/C1-type domain-containing protein n=1 Tax=Kitasatospora cystarginea TaxID=58350 RepID=A0ABP5RNW0_9ACTN